METERITLSQRERDRLKVLHEVQQKHLTQVAAAARLKVTDRQVRPCHQTATRHHQTLTRHGHRACPSKINIFPASTLGVYCWRYAEHMEGPWVCPVTNADGRLPN